MRRREAVSRPWSSALFGVLMAFSVSCVEASGNGGGGAFQLDVGYGADAATDTHKDATQDSLSSDVTLPTSATADLVPEGRYASLQRLSTLMSLPPAGSAVESVNFSLGLHDVSHSAGKVAVSSRTCGMWQPAVLQVETVFSDAFVKAIPVWTSEIVIGPGADGKVSFTLLPKALLFGVSLKDPANDPLPTSGDEPTVIDPDKDGHPGVTVKLVGIINGKMYVVQRRTSGLSGHLTPASGRAEGLLLGDVEQRVLGADPPELTQVDLSPAKHPDASRSTFVWLPVDSTMSCEQLMKLGEPLFAP